MISGNHCLQKSCQQKSCVQIKKHIFPGSNQTGRSGQYLAGSGPEPELKKVAGSTGTGYWSYTARDHFYFSLVPETEIIALNIHETLLHHLRSKDLSNCHVQTFHSSKHFAEMIELFMISMFK